ncbi:hypothetical protein PoB_005151100 [Plakobranchus ocellatus]|uniref:Uncharacterized protein n=1 Tax=Plakobranchus ocellatus TaxID=259542 RepID=A0AAV4C0X2_9GAST|nr:hypothetical protein PoB_005151100 [Plakobranchus ocellatus]
MTDDRSRKWPDTPANEILWRGHRVAMSTAAKIMRKILRGVISGFQALRLARAPVAGLELATESSQQFSRRVLCPLSHQGAQQSTCMIHRLTRRPRAEICKHRSIV